jgi:hypothetical protein
MSQSPSDHSDCTCIWKGRMQGPRGWVELISERDPECSVHGDAAYHGSVVTDEEEQS